MLHLSKSDLIGCFGPTCSTLNMSVFIKNKTKTLSFFFIIIYLFYDDDDEDGIGGGWTEPLNSFVN